jgi:hypothetical protein
MGVVAVGYPISRHKKQLFHKLAHVGSGMGTDLSDVKITIPTFKVCAFEVNLENTHSLTS